MQNPPTSPVAFQLTPWISAGSGHPSGLSEREIQILTLLGNGYTSEEIGKVLYISACTVSSHRRNMIAKIGAKNTAHLVYMACKAGWIE